MFVGDKKNSDSKKKSSMMVKGLGAEGQIIKMRWNLAQLQGCQILPFK